MSKIKVAVGGFAVAVMLGAMLPASRALAAAHKVDCSKVMDEINGGKSTKEAAKDLHISRSSVRRCVKRAKAEGGAMASPAAAASPAAEMAPPAAAPAPAAPAPAAPAPATSPAH
jgi:DNA-binding CsgD family transcriptional regulator